MELIVNGKIVRCNREENSSLFYATIGGLGLTGVITRVAIRLKKASRFVEVEHRNYNSFAPLIEQMSNKGINYDFQVAWIDLLNSPHRSVLSLANHCDSAPPNEIPRRTVPKFHFGLIKAWNMKWFNKLYIQSKKRTQRLSLEEFNNPLDTLAHWNRLMVLRV